MSMHLLPQPLRPDHFLSGSHHYTTSLWCVYESEAGSSPFRIYTSRDIYPHLSQPPSAIAVLSRLPRDKSSGLFGPVTSLGFTSFIPPSLLKGLQSAPAFLLRLPN
ncbi:hypothetical protein NPIL_515831 [Nephila pilipes]|uniref:Uncharacterized protein n=1 Tax=Nephila pilipes TaxID=299642 RepID=A0A8X6U5H5_NEPPI|nr:hypothetical protein NPIL_515831 [Nephila pilipes]